MEANSPPDRSRIEWSGVGLVTLVGLALRLAPIGRLGLNHFDEGIYALGASWSLQPGGLSSLDPMLIPYAPPGYPILGGLAYLVLGRSDGAMIAVSQLAGTLTIPVVAWLARRTFGAGAGFAAATFCAFSGPHIAYSRMALTDASFLLVWLIALGAGMRFLERPGLVRGLVMGLLVGLAQQFKYNGWLAGAIVVGSALMGMLVRPEERKPGKMARIWGYGALAAGVAWLVVWPWFAFVERHGGYSALLRHQRSYLGGLSDWTRHFVTQVDQSHALLGGYWIWGFGLLIAGLTPIVSGSRARKLGFAWVRFDRSDVLGLLGVSLAVGVCFLAGLMPEPFIWPLLIGFPGGRLKDLFGEARPSTFVVGLGWAVLFHLTPFYHPYARLWLPIQAIHWLILGWLVAGGLSKTRSIFQQCWKLMCGSSWWLVLLRTYWLMSVLVVLVFIAWRMSPLGFLVPQAGLFAPADALYRSTVHLSQILPPEVRGLRVLVRPSVTFYLAGRIPLLPMAGSDQLRSKGDPRVWALVDSAILRSEGKSAMDGSSRAWLEPFREGWEIVEEFPTDPPLATLLDLDPSLARTNSGDRSYPLWLLRPRNAKVNR